jgi:hypothetical protein
VRYAAAAGAAAPPTASGTKVPTLRYSQPPRRNRAKARFRRHPGARSVPRATPKRRRSCASRCCRDTASCKMFVFIPPSEHAPRASVGRSGAAFGAVARGAERQRGSRGPACLSAASLQARRWREYRRVGTKCPTTQAAPLRPTLARYRTHKRRLHGSCVEKFDWISRWLFNQQVAKALLVRSRARRDVARRNIGTFAEEVLFHLR